MSYRPLILVVDDIDINRELICDIMESNDFRTLVAENGKEAVEIALKEIPDLILMDLEMPVMNGIDAIKELMKESATSRIPIIVLTGLNEKEDRIKAFDSGAMDYVNKPFDTHELLSHVRSYLRFSLLNKKYVLSTISQETDLPNRAALRERLEEYSQPRLFLLKVDELESISRFYGEHTGNEIEKDIAQFLDQNCMDIFESKTALFHLGRGLFGFLTENGPVDHSHQDDKRIAAELLERYSRHKIEIRKVQHESSLTIVIGKQKQKIIENAELALDAAQQNKNNVVVVDDIIEEIYQNIGDNIFWIQKIREGLIDNRFIPFFQPIRNNLTGNIDKYESLVRLKSKEGEIISPFKFLKIAKNSRYYHDITRLVISKTIDTFKTRREQFSINLSALDIENQEMQQFMIRKLEEVPDIASRMTFEIVEQEGFKYVDLLKQFISQVTRYGVKIALDDFGSGYSNFRTMLDMDIDYLKIDGSLIKNIDTDIASRNVVETIKTFAEKNRIKTIAEFVENAEVLKILEDMGIDYSQGYFIGKPEPEV